MYKSVFDLSPAEMEELKQSYFYQLQDENPEILQGITEAEQIPDDIIQEHYNGVDRNKAFSIRVRGLLKWGL